MWESSRTLDLFVKEYGNIKQITLGGSECRFQEAREHSRCERHDPCRAPTIRRGPEELASGASVDIIAIATGMTEADVRLLIDEISKEWHDYARIKSIYIFHSYGQLAILIKGHAWHFHKKYQIIWRIDFLSLILHYDFCYMQEFEFLRR